MAITPATLKGTRDFSSTEIARRTYLKTTLQKSFECYGFQPIETPAMERLETLSGNYGEEGERLIFKILNSGEKVKKADLASLEAGEYKRFSQSLSEKALRYDLTVPLARYVAQHYNELSFPFRRYQIQPVWRADRPQHGRFQEFYQCDADIIGERSLWQEVEMVRLYDTAFKALGLKGTKLKINHRNILASIAECIDAKDKLNDLTVTLDKWDKVGQEGVQQDLIKKGFSKKAIEILFDLLEPKKSFQEKMDELRQLFNVKKVDTSGLEELTFVLKEIKTQDLFIELELDLTLARGLHYYTGMIVEVLPPKSVKMGSIGGGGRYDNLTETFGLKDMPGIGISFGFERIFLVLETLNLFPKTIHQPSPVLFINFGGEATTKCFDLVSKLRAEGIPAELYPTTAKIKKQMLYANKKKTQKVVLIGSDELEQNIFVLKNMETGEQQSHPFSNLIEIFKH
ncbi:MAG: histidine--tRNA ligase [Flavobacteriaceae bacterium]|nr:histidine--tRNA ligase [Flavobacteriaceae bacterium]